MDEKLLDSWKESGTDIESFKEAVKNISASTSTMLIRAKDVKVLSNTQSVNPASLKFYKLDPQDLWDTSSGRHTVCEAYMKREGFTDRGVVELVKELENDTKLLLQIDSKIYFTSINMLNTFGLRTGVAGNAMLNPCLERDILIAKCLNSDDEMTAIVRRAGGVRKIFSTLSAKYPYVPQSICADILTRIETDGKLGDAVGYNWSVDNQFAEIYLEFPEKAEELMAIYGLDREVTPGLYICNSDTGESSIIVRSTWRIGTAVIILDEFRRKHSGNFNIDDILEGIDEIVFSKYTLLPEKLCDLMSIDITDPDWKALTKTKFRAANRKAIEFVIKSIFKQIKVVDATTKSIEKELYEALCDEIDYDLSYTAYDICMMIMTLPSRTIIGLSDTYKTSFGKACGKAAYCKYERPEIKTSIKLAV